MLVLMEVSGLACQIQLTGAGLVLRGSITVAIDALLQCDAPELQAMMRGEKTVPECLKPWL